MPRILLIGNCPEFKAGLEAAQSLAGCEIVTAAGNVDAIRQARDRAIDVVITDPDTPVSDDLALIDEFRVSRPGLKAIVLTPMAASVEMVAALRAQVFACFVAPFNVGEVADMTKCAMDAVDWREGICIASGRPNWVSLKVNCAMVNAERLMHFMNGCRHELPDHDRDNLLVAFREMLMNAMEHGAGFDPEKVVHVTAVRTQKAIVYHFRDPGRGFDPSQLVYSALSNTDEEPLGHVARRSDAGLRPGGFGILLARQVVDEMFYNEPGNEVLLIKRFAD